MNLNVVATFNTLGAAEALKQHLETVGIHAVIHDESRLQRFWYMVNPTAAKKVSVSCKDAEVAGCLIEEWKKSESFMKDAVWCPKCKSPKIQYPQFTRKFITPTLAQFFTRIHLFPREFYCEDCHYVWPKKEEPEPETDFLGWPKETKP